MRRAVVDWSRGCKSLTDWSTLPHTGRTISYNVLVTRPYWISVESILVVQRISGTISPMPPLRLSSPHPHIFTFPHPLIPLLSYHHISTSHISNAFIPLIPLTLYPQIPTSHRTLILSIPHSLIP